MKQEYIILRNPYCAGSSEFSEEDEVLLPCVEIRELDLGDIARIHEDEDVVAITANMPIELNSLSSVDELNSGVAREKVITWGVEEMGTLDTSLDGSGMVAAILDTGIDRDHPAFAGMEIIEKDFTGDGNGDQHGHGTHCAGTIFGQDVGGLQIGMAPGIDRALVGKVLDDEGKGESWSAIQALRWAAENGANVASFSFRLCFTSYVEQLVDSGYSRDVATAFALEAYHMTVKFYQKFVAILRLRSEALVIVAGVGASSRRIENSAGDRSVEAPACVEGVISVGALGRGVHNVVFAEFSDSGAVGVAPGVGVISARAGSADLISMDGTSMAANHVAGASLLWGQFLKEKRELTSFTLEVKVTRSGDNRSHIAPGCRQIDLGKGLIQAPMNERERNVPARASMLHKGDSFYKTVPLDTQELLTFDLDPVIRRKRELMRLRKFGNPPKRGGF